MENECGGSMISAAKREPPVPEVVQIVQVAAGRMHSLALGADGRLYEWGLPPCAFIGSNVDVWRPRERRFLRTTKSAHAQIVSIVTGPVQSAMVCADGTVWSWGCGFCGRLGHGDDSPRESPTLLVCPGPQPPRPCNHRARPFFVAPAEGQLEHDCPHYPGTDLIT